MFTLEPGYKEVNFSDFEFAKWLRKHRAIDNFVSHKPIGDFGLVEWFNNAEKTNRVAYAWYDNSMKTKQRIAIR